MQPEITSCSEIKAGMLFYSSISQEKVFEVSHLFRSRRIEVTLPAGSTVDVYLTTPDVTHGLILLGTNLNLMAVPGVVNYTRVKFDQPRTYQLLCHEYCGTGHDRMAATLRIVDPAQFEASKSVLTQPQPSDPAYRLLETKECLTCHTIDGESSIGPTFKGMFGRSTKLTNGKTVAADDAYIRNAIVNPEATLVEGFDNVMPQPELTEQEVTEIMEYLKTLK